MYGHAFECLLCEVFDEHDLFEYDWTDVANSQTSPASFDPIDSGYDEVLSRHDPSTLVRGSIFWEEEGDLWEFKSVSSTNPAKAITADLARYAIGFLNRFGGTMLFGVADDGTVEGVSIRRDQRDDLGKRIKAELLNITPAVPLGAFKLTFRPVIGAANLLPDCYVVALEIPAGKSNEMFFRTERTWARLGKETRSLSGHELFAHILATYRCGGRKLREKKEGTRQPPSGRSIQKR